MNTWMYFLLAASMKAGVLVVLILLVNRLLQRWLSAKWRFMLWCVVLLRLVMPPVISTQMSLFNLWPTSLEHRNAPGPVALEHRNAQGPVSLEHKDQGPVTLGHKTLRATSVAPNLFSIHRDVPAKVKKSPQPLAATTTVPSISWPTILFGLWAVVMAGFMGVLLRNQWRLRNFLRTTEAVEDAQLNQLLRSCKQELRLDIPVILSQSDAIPSPFLVGAFRPRIVLPANFTQTLSVREQRYVLLHELAHIRRHDLLLNWLAAVMQAMHWFNPLTWMALRRLRLEQELACDETVLAALSASERRSYGNTLINMSEFGLNYATVGAVGLKEDKMDLRRRIVMISQYRPANKYCGKIALLLLISVMGVGLTECTTASKANSQEAQAKNGEDPVVGQWINAAVPERAKGFVLKADGTVVTLEKFRRRGMGAYTNILGWKRIDPGHIELTERTGGNGKLVTENYTYAAQKNADGTLSLKEESKQGHFQGTFTPPTPETKMEVVDETVLLDSMPEAAKASLIKELEGGKFSWIEKGFEDELIMDWKGKVTGTITYYADSIQPNGKHLSVLIKENGDLLYKLPGVSSPEVKALEEEQRNQRENGKNCRGKRISHDQVPAKAMAALTKSGKVGDVYQADFNGQPIYTGVVTYENGEIWNITVDVDGEGPFGKWIKNSKEQGEESSNGNEKNEDAKISFDQFPAAVQATVKKELKGGKIQETSKNPHGFASLHWKGKEAGASIYLVEAIKANGSHVMMVVHENGEALYKAYGAGAPENDLAEPLLMFEKQMCVGRTSTYETSFEKLPAAVQATLKKDLEGGKFQYIQKDIPLYVDSYLTWEGKEKGASVYDVRATKANGTDLAMIVHENGEVLYKVYSEGSPEQAISHPVWPFEKQYQEHWDRQERQQREDKEARITIHFDQLPAVLQTIVKREIEGGKIQEILKESDTTGNGKDADATIYLVNAIKANGTSLSVMVQENGEVIYKAYGAGSPENDIIRPLLPLGKEMAKDKTWNDSIPFDQLPAAVQATLKKELEGGEYQHILKDHYYVSQDLTWEGKEKGASTYLIYATKANGTDLAMVVHENGEVLSLEYSEGSPESRIPRPLTPFAKQVMEKHKREAKANPSPEASANAGVPKIGSKKWYKEVSRRLGITDKDGQGPKIRSDEWFAAVGKASGVITAVGEGPEPDSDEWQRAVHRKVFNAE